MRNKEEWLLAILGRGGVVAGGQRGVRWVTNEEAKGLMMDPNYKVDARIVLCGKDLDESLHAGGSDAISIRTITKDWDGMVLDIKTAFLLNAL